MRRILIRTGLRIAVEESGEGPAVIFLHGLAGFKELWRETLPVVRSRGFRALAYDHRGHGHSHYVAPPWSIPDLAEDLALLMDQLEIPAACIVGHSMGGRTAFQFALRYPERLTGLVAVGAHSEAPPPPYDSMLREVRDATARGGLSAFRDAFAALSEIPERVARDAGYAAHFNRWFARNGAPALVAALDAILAMPTLTPQLASIRVPTLAVVGERDTHFLELAAHYERVMPHCRTVVIPGCHHYPMADRPADFNQALVAFLDSAFRGEHGAATGRSTA